MSSACIAFISTMEGDPWGGAEELWWGAAMALRAKGAPVAANVLRWPVRHRRVQQLIDAGVNVHERAGRQPLTRRALMRAMGEKGSLEAVMLRKWLAKTAPRFIVLSEGLVFPPVEIFDVIANAGVPFITISHANRESWWPTDETAAQYRALFGKAHKNYFVSQKNLDLARRQMASPLERAKIVRNPYGISFDHAWQWPSETPDDVLKLACVGRLDPPSKGQDVLLEALAGPPWRARNWRLSFYGDGAMRQSMAALVQSFGLEDKVTFAGHCPVADIWAQNHVLTLTSRYEGLPIVIVEAMMAGRPVLTTDVAGNAELLEEGVSGFIAEAPIVSAVAAALERLWENRANLPAMGQAAAKHVRLEMPRDPIGIFVREIEGLL